MSPAIRQHGLTGVDEDGRLTAPVTASEHPSILGRQDAVIVTVMAPALPFTAVGIGPLLGADTPLAFVMNGIPWWEFPRTWRSAGWPAPAHARPRRTLWETIHPGNAIGGVVYLACLLNRRASGSEFSRRAWQ
jgi:2-dehydropantoate 2-reductase